MRFPDPPVVSLRLVNSGVGIRPIVEVDPVGDVREHVGGEEGGV